MSRPLSQSQRFSKRATLLTCAIYVVGITLPGCTGTEEVTVTHNPVAAALTDDTAPPISAHDPSLNYKGRYGDIENHSQDRFRFDVAAYSDEAEKTKGETLYPSHAAFMSNTYAIASVQTIGTYVKQLDDTIYAGVERAVQDGLQPTIEPKRRILTGALLYLTEHRSAASDDAIALVASAIHLGGETPVVPSDLSAKVAAVETDFLSIPSESKPFGFYTWSEELKRIWQQDRLLQRRLPTAESSCALAQAIAADPSRKAQYIALTQLYGKLTNPLHSSLVSILEIAADSSCLGKGPQAFLSTSATPEVALFEQLYPGGIPGNADLMGDLIEAIRSQKVDLSPKANDGWYQHQLFALETLLVTDKSEERGKIAFMARYKKRLQEAFSTMLVQHRETHAKQSGTSSPVSYETPHTPHFRIEPLATVYVRHARSYVFLENALETVMGKEFLDNAKAVDASGTTTEPLRTRIRRARDLFFGLYIVASQDIGLKFSLAIAGDPEPSQWTALGEAADKWLVGLENDAIMKSDVRVIVPIAHLDNHRMKYWAVIGVRGTLAGYSYITGMDVTPPKPEDQARTWLATEQFLEVESSDTPMNRDEFRALCDSAKSAEAIQAALEGR